MSLLSEALPEALPIDEEVAKVMRGLPWMDCWFAIVRRVCGREQIIGTGRLKSRKLQKINVEVGY